jgi:ribosome-associated protein
MESEQLKSLVTDALKELKAADVAVIDVAEVSGFTDYMVIASGTSTRHVKSLAENLIRRCRSAGVRPLGVEGEGVAEWILVDLGDVVAHIMLPEVRDFYNLEKLWRLVERSDGAQVG